MSQAITISASNVGFGNNMAGNPGDSTRTVTTSNTSSNFSDDNDLRITFNDAGDKILQIEVLDDEGNVLSTFRGQNDQNNDPLTDPDSAFEGASLQGDQQTDEIGGFTQLGNFREVGNTGNTFTSGSSGSFFFIAPNIDIADTSTVLPANQDLNGDGNIDDFDAGNIPCLAAGTLVETDKGEVAVETLEVGDLVRTKDNGLQKVRFAAKRQVSAENALAPVVISKGALGNTRELVVSPNHRMLVSGPRVEFLFGEREMLVAAKDLVDGDQIYVRAGGEVTYVHIAFDRHEIIFAEGAPTESLQPMAKDAASFGGAAYKELVEIYPELASGNAVAKVARPVLRSSEARLLH